MEPHVRSIHTQARARQQFMPTVSGRGMLHPKMITWGGGGELYSKRPTKLPLMAVLGHFPFNIAVRGTYTRTLHHRACIAVPIKYISLLSWYSTLIQS